MSRYLKWTAGACVAVLILAADAFLLFLAADYLFPFPEASMHRKTAAVISDSRGRPLRFFLPEDNRWRFEVGLEDISPGLVEAVIASEDRWFRHHPGVNPLALVRAFYVNVRAGRVVSGASTIPMQRARMAEPKSRNVASKIKEAFRAFQLKWRYEDDELLEIYLNIAPYGGNIEGVAAASYFYFGKSPRVLSPAEIALLTALPRSPVAYDPTRNPGSALRERNKVLRQLAEIGVFTEEDAERYAGEPVPEKRRLQPFSAPHFSEYVYQKVSRGGGAQTTLDSSIQRIAGEIAARHIDNLRRDGIEHLAIVVIDNETRSLKALVGSADYFDKKSSGQVNLALARRSPGSALKPFLYAMAIDRGIVIPDTYVLDVPTDYSGYVAENYDGTYRGRITLRYALILSLNAPAVRLLAQVGLGEFHELLLKGGLATLDRPSGKYGLPLILGSGEVTLLDLTNLYATLASGGVHRPLRVIDDGVRNHDETRLFSPEAAFLTTDALTELKRPDMSSNTWALTRDVPEVAWKTGTSYGHRDAWSLGYSTRYTIGVWVGNPGGRGQKGISGGGHAAPILFDLFRGIEGDGARIAMPDGLNLGTIEVCRSSHMLPTPYCGQRDRVTYVKGVSRLKRDTYSKQIFVDKETGELLLGQCIGERPHEARTVTTYPAELVAWRMAEGKSVETMPPLSPLCKDVPSESPPRIVSPDRTTPYRVLNGMPSEYQRVELIARVAEEVNMLYWYQDGKLIASSKPYKRVFIPLEAGAHDLVVVDSSGRSDSVTYRVEKTGHVEVVGR
ncbi:MAG: penicillin-binding protein 1C [Candidatus Dadabacteria bacterium]|nr:penicillin-binding protein 1C [Candidatus Dadabacteria bacterium]